MWVSVNGKLRVLGARDEGSIPSTRTRIFDFFENFLYNIYRKKKISQVNKVPLSQNSVIPKRSLEVE